MGECKSETCSRYITRIHHDHLYLYPANEALRLTLSKIVEIQRMVQCDALCIPTLELLQNYHGTPESPLSASDQEMCGSST